MDSNNILKALQESDFNYNSGSEYEPTSSDENSDIYRYSKKYFSKCIANF